MSQKEVRDNFKWEREKHFGFFLPYYRERNWQVIKDNIDGNTRIDWDVRLETFAGEYKLVDEKALRKEHDICFVELIQDTRTKSWGWLFGKNDWVLYGSWNENQISSLYRIEKKELKEYVFGLSGSPKVWINSKGWGITWNIIIPWLELQKKGIAEKLL